MIRRASGTSNWLFLAAVGALVVAGCKRKETAAGPTPARSAQAPNPSALVGTANFYLELGSLYERYQDSKSAADNFTRSIEKAESPGQKVRGYLGLARAKNAQGDLDGAIAALESGLRQADLPSGLRENEELLELMGRLYAVKGRFEDCERTYRNLLTVTKDPYRRDHILNVEVTMLKDAGRLNDAIAQREKSLQNQPQDENALRFLALAYSGGNTVTGSMAHRPEAERPASADGLAKAAAIYERLHQLHRSDWQIRQTLLALYEQAGRIDDALALIQAGAPAVSGGPRAEAACSPALTVPHPRPPEVETAEQRVRLLIRSGRREQALAETAKLAKLRTEGVGMQALSASARLYAEQDRLDSAFATLDTAAKMAKTRGEQRELALARAELLSRRAAPAELKSLFEQWKRSDDPCLRAEAVRREQMIPLQLAVQPAQAQPVAPTEQLN